MTNSNIIASRKTQVCSALKNQDARIGFSYLCYGVVGGTVIDDNNRQIAVVAMAQRFETQERVAPAIPVQNDATYRRLWAQANTQSTEIARYNIAKGAL